MDYRGYTALEQALTHARDDVFKKQTIELHKLQRKLDNLQRRHSNLVFYTKYEAQLCCKSPHCCQSCGMYFCPDGTETQSFFKFFYNKNPDKFILNYPGWVIERAFLCNTCLHKTKSHAELCTKFNASYWLDYNIYRFLTNDDFESNEWPPGDDNQRVERFFTYPLAVKTLGSTMYNGRDDLTTEEMNEIKKMHNVAAYVIQRALRCRCDYRNLEVGVIPIAVGNLIRG